MAWAKDDDDNNHDNDDDNDDKWQNGYDGTEVWEVKKLMVSSLELIVFSLTTNQPLCKMINLVI